MNIELDTDNRISIDCIEDVVKARQYGSLIAQQMGFSSTRAMIVATSISELARNIVLYADRGVIIIEQKLKGSKAGLVISAVDSGPGIKNLDAVMKNGSSSPAGTSFGLSGVKQMADDFDIRSCPVEGTEVTVVVWPE